MSTQRPHVRKWMLSLFAWDGLMPVIVFLAPAIVRALVPRNHRAIEATSVMLPIVAFLIRLAVGLRQVSRNRVRQGVQTFQMIALFLGLVVLVLIDTLVILMWEIPGVGNHIGDMLVLLCLFSIYLTLMALAFYPGRGQTVPEGDGEILSDGSEEPPHGLV